MIHMPPSPSLVDALGNPLRETEFQGTHCTEEHAALTREAMEAAVRELLPRRPEPGDFDIRLPSFFPVSLPPSGLVRIVHIDMPDEPLTSLFREKSRTWLGRQQP